MIDKICKHLDITEAQIYASGDAGETMIVVLVDGRKFVIDKADLPQDEPKPAAKAPAKKQATKKEAKS